jgi:hypothetical protein
VAKTNPQQRTSDNDSLTAAQRLRHWCCRLRESGSRSSSSPPISLESVMPSSRPPQPRRPVIVVVSAVLAVLGLLLAPTTPAHAYPYASDSGPTLTLPAEPTFARHVVRDRG